MSLVLFTCMVGLIIAPQKVSYVNSILSLVAVALGAGAAGTLNMWYESDLDALMTRTCLRPIPAGQLQKTNCFWYYAYFWLSFFIIFLFKFNLASLLLFTIGFYFSFTQFG